MSDAATVRVFKDWLEREYPGTVWDVVVEPFEDGGAPVGAAGEVGGADSGRVDHEEVGVAA